MSNSADVAQLYKNVVEEVMRMVRTDFANMGVDEQVLVDLQSMWEQKLLDSRVFNSQDFPITAMREYQQGNSFFYPSSGRPPFAYAPGGSAASMPLTAPYPSTRPYPMYYPTQQRPVMVPHLPIPHGFGQQPMQPIQQQQEELEQEQVVKKEEKEPNERSIPQFDGGDDEITTIDVSKYSKVEFEFTIPQFDGANGDTDNNSNVDNLDENEEEETREAKRTRIDAYVLQSLLNQPDSKSSLTPTATETLAPPEPVVEKETVIDELGSDLDDDDDDEAALDDENVNDLILCQYEKISRVRTRWRGVLRAGIVHVNDSDFCFSRANTDFDWI